MVSYGLRRNAAIVLVLVLARDAGRDILLGVSSPGFSGVTTWDRLVLGADCDLVLIWFWSEILG